MDKTIMPLLLLVALISVSFESYGFDIQAGKEKAAACAGCHGIKGVSSNPMWPNLAGQNLGYLSTQIKNFRDGKRINSMMNNMVKTLTNEDADNIAAYYSSL